MKYGTDKQSSWYNSLAGKLTLNQGTNDFDFSALPMYGGDVTGDQDGAPDGKIDILDFSYIKSRADSPEVVQGEPGSNVAGDVDGNCQVNTGDLRVLRESLKAIYDQLY